jgi:hypothetical protein
VRIPLRGLEVADHHEPLPRGALADDDILDLEMLVDLAEPALPRAGLDDGSVHPG